MGIIYEPSGKAKDYAQLAVNLYKGCDHRCTYCFGPSSLRKEREIFHSDNQPKKDALIRFEKEATKLSEAGDDREILLSFVTDPYQAIENDLRITRQAIEILIKNNLRFTILTKGGPTAARDFELLKNYDKASFGSTICFTKQDDADKWEPNAPEIDTRIEAINCAHEMGIRTWVSLEPVIDTDQTFELIEEIHPIVDHWKVGKLNYQNLEVDWMKFREDVTKQLDSVGANYYLKKSLTDIKESQKKVKPKSVSFAGNGNRKSKEAEEAGPWTESVIPTRKGNRNILVIAPHGHKSDDEGTYQLARQLADELDCYAVVNEIYRKPENVKASEKYEKKYLVDLNCWPEIENSKEAMTDFFGPIEEFKDQILKKSDSLLILHIHGIGDDNREKVANLLSEFKERPDDLHLLIGYGQHRKYKNRKTAELDKFVKPLMTELYKVGVKSSIAPVDPITDENGKNQWYCGNDKRRLNQELCDQKENTQSLQLEFKYGGLRDKPKEAALKFAKALKEVLKVHEIYTDFMAIFQRKSERAMLEAGLYLFTTFYKNEINAVKIDKKKESLNSLHKYIQDLHGKDPVAPKKSWIYNSVKLAVEYKELKAYLKDDFHMYGNDLNLSQKVLLFTENDLEKKAQFIRETAAFIKESGKTLTFLEFKKRFDASRPKQKPIRTRMPSLLSIIDKPEKLFANEMSKLLTSESLQKLPSPTIENVRVRAKENIGKIETNMKLETNYVKRYKELIEAIKNTSQQQPEEHSPAPSPQKKVRIHDNKGNGDI